MDTAQQPQPPKLLFKLLDLIIAKFATGDIFFSIFLLLLFCFCTWGDLSQL